MKNVIGYLNPVFAGAQQNDSHEFCVWFLDRLSSELMHRLTTPMTNMSKQLVDMPSPPLPRHPHQRRNHSNDRNLSSNESDDGDEESGDEDENNKTDGQNPTANEQG